MGEIVRRRVYTRQSVSTTINTTCKKYNNREWNHNAPATVDEGRRFAVKMAPNLHSFLLFFITLPLLILSQCQESDTTDYALYEVPESSFYSNASSTSRYPYALEADKAISLVGYERVLDIEIDGQSWTVNEDLSNRDGQIVFASKPGQQRIMPKTAELFNPKADPKYPRYAGLKIADVGMALDDLLATALLKDGEPVEAQVRSTIPPITSGPGTEWTTIIGNVQANDVMSVFETGGTRAFSPHLTMPGLGEYALGRGEGYVGGWMPAVRKVFPTPEKPNEYYETIVFGDVEDPDPFQIRTWHRMAHFLDGKMIKATYGHSYNTFSKVQGGPEPAAFYKALFKFGEYVGDD